MSVRADDSSEKPSGEVTESQKVNEDPSTPSLKLEIRDMPNQEILPASGAERGSSGKKPGRFEVLDKNQIPSLLQEDPAQSDDRSSKKDQKKRLKELVSCSEEEKEASKPSEAFEVFGRNEALKLLGECFEPLIKFK